MSEFDVTLCKFYDNEICYNEECPVKYCEGYQCIYKERYLLREHCKFIDETNKILNEQKESLLKENNRYKQCLDEIEEICIHETMNLTDSCVNGGRYVEILEKIKEVKGNE